MANKKITRQLSIFINGNEVKNSLGAIGREIAKVKAKLKEANDPKDIKKYKSELNNLGKKYSDVKEEIHGTNAVLEKARSHWDNMFSGFLSGNLTQASEGLKGLLGNLKNITKAAWAFVATPIGAALAAVAAIGLGVKKWVAYNLEIEKTNQLIRDLTQETGTSVNSIRIQAEVLKNTFNVEINESVETAKSLVKSFGISYNDAFKIIEDGAIRGKLKNNEYLESLKEYPVQFKNAGFSAQDFANIVSTGIDLSIYSDKLPDAIKEFNLAITEQTEAAKEALTNAFGEKFTTKLLRNLKNGSITAKDALALISAEAETIGLNSQQAQLLTADLFKGAGEDAGGALKIFEAVNLALNQQKKPLTEIQQIQKQQLEANKELNSVYTQLFASGSKGFNLWIQKGKLFATETLIKILKGGVNLYNWFVDLNNESGLFSAILKSLGIAATNSFEVLGILLSGAWDSFKGLGNIVAGVFTLDWDRIKQGFNQGASTLTNVLEELKTKAINDAKDIVEAWNGKNKMGKLSLDEFIANDTPTPVNNNDTTITSDDNSNNENELTPQDQQIIESKKKLAEFLDQWEADQALQKELEKYDKEAQAEEEEILKLENKLLKMEEEAGIIGLKEEELSQADKALKERLEEAKEQGVAAIRKKYANKRQKDKEKADKEYEKKLKEHHKRLAKAEQELEDAKKRALSFGISTLKSMFGEKTGIYKAMFALEKALAISEIIATTAKSNALAKSTDAAVPWVIPPGIPNPAKPLSVATMAKSIIANKINAGIQIGTIAATAIKGFKEGGPTGNTPIYKDEYGAVTGVVHENEWVAPKWMNESPRYAPTIQWLESERKKELGQFFEGGNTTKSEAEENSLPAEPTSNDNTRSDMLIQFLQKLDSKLDQGFKGYIVPDYEDFLNRKEIDKEHEEIFKNTRI